MNRRKILIYLTLLLTIACAAIQASSQETTPTQKPDSAAAFRRIPAADECAQLLDRTLDAYEKLTQAKADADALSLTRAELVAKEREYNAELLKAVSLLVSSEKRNKSFFKKLGEQLARILEKATDPATLATIAGLILISRNLSR